MPHRRNTHAVGHENKHLDLYTCCTIVYGDYIRSILQCTLLKRHCDVATRTVRGRHIFHSHIKLMWV